MKENVKVMYRITFPSKRRLKDKGKEKVNIKDNYHKKEAKKLKSSHCCFIKWEPSATWKGFITSEARALFKYGKYREEEEKWNVHIRMLLVFIVPSSLPVAKPWLYFVYVSCFLCMFFSICSGADTDFCNQLCLGEFYTSQDQYFWLSAGLPKHPQWEHIHLLYYSIDLVYTKKSMAQVPEVQAYRKCSFCCATLAAQKVISHFNPTFTRHRSTRLANFATTTGSLTCSMH